MDSTEDSTNTPTKPYIFICKFTDMVQDMILLAMIGLMALMGMLGVLGVIAGFLGYMGA